jgi:peroxiredoxin
LKVHFKQQETEFMALTVGMDAPAFTAKDTNGNTVSLSDFAGKTVVLYFYPKDDTPGLHQTSSKFPGQLCRISRQRNGCVRCQYG